MCRILCDGKSMNGFDTNLNLLLLFNRVEGGKKIINVFTLTCDVCSPPLSHICMGMGAWGGLMPIFVGGPYMCNLGGIP